MVLALTSLHIRHIVDPDTWDKENRCAFLKNSPTKSTDQLDIGLFRLTMPSRRTVKFTESVLFKYRLYCRSDSTEKVLITHQHQSRCAKMDFEFDRVDRQASAVATTFVGVRILFFPPCRYYTAGS